MVHTYSCLLPKWNHCFGQAPIHPCSSSKAKIILHTVIMISQNKNLIQTIIINVTINTLKNQINLLKSDWWWLFLNRDPNFKLGTFLHPIPQNLQSACSRILLATKSTHPQNLDRRLVYEAAQENPQNLGRPKTWSCWELTFTSHFHKPTANHPHTFTKMHNPHSHASKRTAPITQIHK